MFIDNKYKKIYFSIISNAKCRSEIDGYHEIHHIIPKSLGGSNDQSNLCKLSAREHFICHALLVKMTSGAHKQSMSYALNMMLVKGSKNNNRYNPSSRLYQMAKEMASHSKSIALKGKSYCEIYGENANDIAQNRTKHFRGKKQSSETILKRAEKLKGQKRSDSQKQLMSVRQIEIVASRTEEQKKAYSEAMSKAKKGVPLGPKTDEHRAKLSAANKGISRGPMSEEHKEKLRKPKKNTANMKKPKSPEHIAAIKAAWDKKRNS